MVYKQDYSQLKVKVKELKKSYNFEGLYHFTDISNLKQIFDNGFLASRYYLECKGIEYKDGANHDVLDKASDFVHKCTRFYYRPKTPTLYDNEGIKVLGYCNEVHIPTPVYLLFDEKLIYHKNSSFSNGNATTSEIGNTSSFFENMDWFYIFHDRSFNMSERNYIVNKRQAELLYDGTVSLKYLKKIIFRCESDKKHAINLYGDNDKYYVDNTIFSDKDRKDETRKKYRNNYIDDYNVEYQYKKFNRLNSINLNTSFIHPMKTNSNNIPLEYNFDIKIKNRKGISIPITSIQMNWLIDSIFSTCSFKNLRITIVPALNEDYSWLELYLNNSKVIEEPISRYLIDSISAQIVSQKNVNELHLLINYNSLQFKKHIHKVELVYDNGEKISSELSFAEGEHLMRVFKFVEISNLYKINYYIDNNLCYSKTVANINSDNLLKV